eukprot:TRINITY_DN93070_c0_g1_i1.p1 TRINITY_DN93070_c0_g1~~TRINITY_DN93070_c0_g1_i1.p1  ORF type:complete len:341 (-),score=48.57 TRINITY_DN93070_c0_g1_i1:223-1245(-)
MPIYEEKLICPLAVRFTQSHIRPVFQDGREIADTIEEMSTRPGTGPYDLIIEAPFPAIEIVRWHQKDAFKCEKEARHWFTLDNRRLYCLQKVAAAHWPKKVAAVVQTFYAAPDSAIRKSDSFTVGRSVAIGHSMKQIVERFDWRDEVEDKDDEIAKQLVVDDDAKMSVSDLLDTPPPPSMLDLFLRKQTTGGPVSPHSPCAARSEDSTRCGSSTASALDAADEDVGSRRRQVPAAGEGGKPEKWRTVMLRNLAGTWTDTHGGTYEVTESGDNTWSCVQATDSGAKEVTLLYDEESDCICWGNTWNTYANASVLHTRRKPGFFQWWDQRRRRNGTRWSRVS